jgi:hypothetical protein
MQHHNLVIIQSYGSRAEADWAKGALEDAGIQAMIQADTGGGMREHLAWSGAGFKILVREEEASMARDVLTPPGEADESLNSGDRTESRPSNAVAPVYLEATHSGLVHHKRYLAA